MGFNHFTNINCQKPLLKIGLESSIIILMVQTIQLPQTKEYKQITTVTIGGAIEKYFFRGTKPDDLIRKYEFLTGMPTVPPIWAFGWQ